MTIAQVRWDDPDSAGSEVQPATGQLKLQVVIYLSKIGAAFPELEMRSCEEYAKAFDWGIALTVVDEEMELEPGQRPMFQAVLKEITAEEAGAVLVPSKATISPIEGEFNEIARRIEKAGGFIQVASR